MHCTIETRLSFDNLLRISNVQFNRFAAVSVHIIHSLN